MLERNHRSELLPEARTPAAILDRALAQAGPPDPPRGWLREALRELSDPRTVLDAALTFGGVAGLVLVLLGALGG